MRKRKRRSDYGVERKAPEDKKILFSVTAMKESKEYVYNLGLKEKSGKKSLGEGFDRIVKEHKSFSEGK